MKITRVLFAFALTTIVLASTAAAAQTGGGEESPGGATPTPALINETVPPTPNAAQAQSVKLDTPVTVTISGDAPAVLSYKSTGNETLSIVARSLEADGVLDPMLTVYDASNSEIASNDDHRTSRTDLAPRDALIDGLTLATAGRYIIQVTSVDAAQGNVEVTISSGGGSLSSQSGTETISDEVPSNSSYTYDFQGSAGEVVTISVRATDNQLDPAVSLQDSSGAEVASNDDQTTDSSLGPYDSQIADFALPDSGTYTVVITGFAGIGGTFDLTIARGSGGEKSVASPTPVPETPTPNETEVTQVIEDTIDSSGTYIYNLDAQAGDVYTITVQGESSDFDPHISVYLDNHYIADNDDYGSSDPDLRSRDSRIYNLIMRETGTYELDIRDYNDTGSTFTLTLTRVATGAPTGDPVDVVQLGSIESGDTYSYSFEAQAGDYVSITVRYLTTGLDPYVTLLDADGTVLFDNDDEGSNFGDFAYYDSHISNYHITTSGTYTIEVSGVQGSSGTFGLTIGTLR